VNYNVRMNARNIILISLAVLTGLSWACSGALVTAGVMMSDQPPPRFQPAGFVAAEDLHAFMQREAIVNGGPQPAGRGVVRMVLVALGVVAFIVGLGFLAGLCARLILPGPATSPAPAAAGSCSAPAHLPGLAP
jgi:hypothetical protein